MTPTLNQSENRSELNILTKLADFIDQLRQENEQLIDLCNEKGIAIPDDLIYKGPDDQLQPDSP